MLDEDRNFVALNEAIIKKKMMVKYNKKLKPHTIKIRDLVLWKPDVGLKNVGQGILALNL